MNKKFTQFKWFAAMIMLVVAMVMPSTAWAQSYDENGFGSDESNPYQPAKQVSETYHSELNGTHSGYYAIENVGQLYWFADKVNNDNTNFGSANAVLTTSITVNSSLIENLNADGTVKETYEVRNWTPIGWYDNANSVEYYYSGTFDGNDNTIRGLYYNVESSDKYVFAGLFGRSKGTIKNIVVKDSYFGLKYLADYTCRVSGVCGGNSGAIKNCHNASNVTVTVNNNYASVGGVCGQNFPEGIIENCNNTGEVNVKGTYLGLGSGGTGGVCGWNVNGTIKGCDNKGEVIGLTNVGGVCGSIRGTGKMQSCYNTAKVSGSDNVGGVCGLYLDHGTPNGNTIESCYNTGKVSGSYYVGGVCGNNDLKGTITNCYYDSDIYTGSAIGANNGTVTNTEGKTTKQFASGEVCYLLNGGKTDGNQAWYQLLETETYPNLDKTNSKNRTVYQCAPCTGVYSNTEGVIKNHNHVNDGNGFLTCTACGDKRFQEATPNASGEYEIGNAGQLCWFAGLVNGTLNDGTLQNTTAKGVLTDNIDLASISNWTPIGNESNRFGGTFDGKNFKVQHMSITQQGYNTGLFGYTNGATIQNICIDGNITLNTTSYTGGYGSIAGRMDNSTISNCHSSVNFTINTNMDASTECIGHIGGIVGKMHEASCAVQGCSYSGTMNLGNNNVKVAAGIVGYATNNKVPITNCRFTGTINSKYEGALIMGGIFGYTRTGGEVKVTNCLQAGTLEKDGNTSLTGMLIGQIFNGYGANAVTNNYYISGKFNVIGTTTGTPTATPATQCSTEQLLSGEICYLLNGSSPDGAWGQQIGTEYPVPGSDKTVYRGYKDCLNITYSNNPEELSEDRVHHNDNGICETCHAYHPATLTTDKYDINGDNTKDNVYEIGNAGQLYWFAALVNGTNGLTQNLAANAVLTANITVNEDVLDENGNLSSNTSDFTSWTPIGGSGNEYSGIFDGNNYTISGLYYNSTYSDNGVFYYAGLFGRIIGTIKNVGVVDSYFELKNISGACGIGGVCGGNRGTITNIYNKGKVIGINENEDYSINVGGVCGVNTDIGKIENCYNAGNVIGNEDTGSNCIHTGGVCGLNYGVITNCYNEGNVSGSDIVGGICGKNDCTSQDCKYTIVNCYNRGTVSGSVICKSLCGNNNVYNRTQNCYYLDTTGSDSYATAKTSTQFASGEVAYLLSQGCTIEDVNYEGSVWKQNIDNGAKDAYPLLDSSHGTVYAGYRHSEATPYCSNSKSYIPSDYGHLHAYDSSAIDEASGNHDKTYQSDFNWTDNDDNTDATVTATFTCEVCGKVETPDMTAVHDDDHTNEAATCTGKGYNYYKTSYSFPGETFTAVYRQEVPASGHDYSGTASINTRKQIYEKYCKRCSVFLEYCATSDGSVEAIEDPEGVFTANDLTLQDATAYDNKAVFTATKFKYTRTFSNTNWTTWYVPFDLTLTEDICAQYDFSRINNVHQYDTDNDGTADKTVVESFRQMPGVTLKANYPYLVKPVSESDLNMVLNLEGVIPALAETNYIDCQSVDFSYTFMGTYTAMGEGGSSYYDPYTLWTDGTWKHFRSLDPMRHYLTVTQRNSSYASVVSLRSIMLSVIGDEGTTGIVNMYSDERKAAETYDLGGRRLPAGASQKGVVIENGKVIIKK